MKQLHFYILFLIFLTGCITINPIYHEKDLIEVPYLTGKWGYLNNQDSTNYWTLIKIGNKKYLAQEYINQREQQSYIAHFIKLKGQIFADFEHIEVEGHFISKVELNKKDSTCSFSLFNSDYLVKLEKENKIELSYKTVVDRSSDYNMGTSYYISESTDRLQELLIEYSDNQSVFDDERKLTLKRMDK